jgi:hypothetical protein
MSENAASPNSSEAFKKLVESATDSSQLQQAIRDHMEAEAAAAQSPAAAAPPPHAVSQDPPPNWSNSKTFYAVGYKGNSRLEVFEYTQEAFDQAMASYRKTGWAF